MKLCFYSDYLATSRGGGERHVLTIALSAAQSHVVTIALPDIEKNQIPEIKQQLAHLVGSSLDSLNFIACPGKKATSFTRFTWFSRFDGVFWVCDGSVPLPVSGRRYLHLQIPFTNTHTSALSRGKLRFWSSHANTNSLFTKTVIQDSWHIDIPTVLWPVVDTEFAQSLTPKKPLILNIGRFFTHLHAKRQDILIQAFAQLRASDPAFESYQLVLIGAIEDEAFVTSLRHQAEGLPVTFIHQLTRKKLKDYLAEAQFYWHAAGFEIDQLKHPEQVEHFGISVAESMAAGCIPLVVGKGGMSEVLGSDLFNTCAWSTVTECVQQTIAIAHDTTQQTAIIAAAKKQAQRFNQRAFDQRVTTYFSDSYYNTPTPLHESN